MTDKRAVSEFTPDILRTMRRMERGDGTGDLVFGTRPTMVRGMSRPVGFLVVENVRDVEETVRKALGLAQTWA